MANTANVRRLTWITAMLTALAVVAATLACASGYAISFSRRINQRPVVWQLGRVSISAEFTVNPGCAPLAQTCWVQRPLGRPRYFSAWVYVTTPPNEPWHLSKWHVLVIPAGRHGG